MFTLARAYWHSGMSAYAELQSAEFASEGRGLFRNPSQREVGTGYFDRIATLIGDGQSSTTALEDSTEAAQFATAAA